MRRKATCTTCTTPYMSAMSEHDTDAAPKTAAEKLAEALARKRGGPTAGAPTDASG